MAISRDEIAEVVYAVIDDLNGQWPDRPPIGKSGTAVLFGRNGSLDSLGLVHFVVGVEQGLADTLGANVTLATEKAMSRERSPFRTVDALVEFIAELIEETSNG